MRRHCVTMVLLVFALLAALLTGCENGVISLPGSSPGGSGFGSGGGRTPAGEEAVVSEIAPDLTGKVQEMAQKYPDTVGWLQIPGTSIDDAVVYHPDDNTYYMRKNLDGDYDFNGVYYADYRSTFGNGSGNELGLNTCIYGHAMTDNEEREQYATRFGPLHDFRNPDYAKAMPYLIFSTGQETMVFEVFAVFTANCNNPALPYNRNDIPAGEFLTMIENEVLPRSLYDYEDVSFTEDDKFLTLSTCIYTMPDGTRLNYETSEIRYAVMAKKVGANTPLKAKATFTVNEDVILDQDGPWVS